jgi:hypothetical protein
MVLFEFILYLKGLYKVKLFISCSNFIWNNSFIWVVNFFKQKFCVQKFIQKDFITLKMIQKGLKKLKKTLCPEGIKSIEFQIQNPFKTFDWIWKSPWFESFDLNPKYSLILNPNSWIKIPKYETKAFLFFLFFWYKL